MTEGIRIVLYKENIEDSEKVDELARVFAKGGEHGVFLAYHLANQYRLAVAQTIANHGALAKVEKYTKIAANLASAGDRAYELLQILDPNSVSHALAREK